MNQRVMDRFNSVLRRLNVAGYRHYHNFQSWMSAQLLASVEPVLLGEAALGRGMLRKDGVLARLKAQGVIIEAPAE